MPATELGSRGSERPAVWRSELRDRYSLLKCKMVYEQVSENTNHGVANVGGERLIPNGEVDSPEKVGFELPMEGCCPAELATQGGSARGVKSIRMRWVGVGADRKGARREITQGPGQGCHLRQWHTGRPGEHLL